MLIFNSIEKIVVLTETEKAILYGLFELVSYEKNDFLLKEGAVCKYEYFIMDGMARSYYIGDSGEEHTSMFFFDGWWTGNILSFQKQIPSTYYIQTLENSMVLRLNKENYVKMFDQVPKLEKYFRILFQNRVLALEEAMETRQSLTATERYHHFSSKYASFIQKIPLKYLASYLNITPSYLSRIRSRKRFA